MDGAWSPLVSISHHTTLESLMESSFQHGTRRVDNGEFERSDSDSTQAAATLAASARIPIPVLANSKPSFSIGDQSPNEVEVTLPFSGNADVVNLFLKNKSFRGTTHATVSVSQYGSVKFKVFAAQSNQETKEKIDGAIQLIRDAWASGVSELESYNSGLVERYTQYLDQRQQVVSNRRSLLEFLND